MSQHIPAIFEDGVIKPLQPLDLPEHQRVWVSLVPDLGTSSVAGEQNGESFFEAASRLGYLGCIEGTPPDLSTNKKYMEGFGARNS